ncbi:MAG: O-methyltransferase [Dysgonamonadaceae bacterium]|jgi:predicted O-methyltransferase YrrM|nr:O-methyltransferase [Dysgonamonadaceae bacterium]
MTLEDYLLRHIDAESEPLSQLYREAHVRLVRPRMVSGHLQGRVLKMLARLLRPKRMLEIGAYTGYATLCLAEALPENGEIHTIEKDDEMEDFIRKQFDRSELKDKIRLHIGDALEIIPRLEGKFDLVFIDADKRLYSEYYDLIFDRVNPGGVILADNTLWSGKVLETPDPSDKQTLGVLNFNEKIKQDTRIEKVILPLRDGLTIIYKL